ncbi:MAG: hypothetical protein RQ985_06550 [Dehalococcoidia bacterium]|jgi:hypothetical protein|nr:hypothetical protein [Dehalococcoidia bacterium]
MDATGLPQVFLILLIEVAVGSLWALWWTQMRGLVPWSFLKFGAFLTAALASLALLVALQMSFPATVGSYPLQWRLGLPLRAALAAYLGLAMAYALAMVRQRPASRYVGLLASLLGLGIVGIGAAVLDGPLWGYLGGFLALGVGALVVGGAVMGMILGHWYLVTPRMSQQPLKELVILLLGGMALQWVVTALALALPHDPIAGGGDVKGNPFLWLKVAGGMALPMLFAYMAYESSAVRAMQSATGLLYIVMVLVLAGEVVGKGLLLSTGAAL